jgi:hypothetical protein
VKIPVRVSSVVRGFATSRVLTAGAIGSAPALAAQSTAGDYSAQPAGLLHITGSTPGVMPQPSAERRWLPDFRVSGFVSRTFGMLGGGAAIAGVGNRLPR